MRGVLLVSIFYFILVNALLPKSFSFYCQTKYARKMPREVRLQLGSREVEHGVPEHVLIAGAGIIGLSTAYYLQKNHGIQSVTLIDPSGEIAPAASGKAGGFLALDWNDQTYTEQLTRRSFSLHQELADALGAFSIQYRRLTCAAVNVNPQVKMARPKGKKMQGVQWAEQVENNAVVGVRPLGDEDSIAQVHPKKLCEQMWNEICKNVPNANIVKGSVTGAVHNEEDGKLVGGQLSDGTIVEGDALLYSCGPWTADFMTGVKYHSVVVPTESVLSQCVFFSGCGDPEIYVRPDSTAYCTGFPEPERRVTERPGEESISPDKVSTILQSVRDACGYKEEEQGINDVTPGGKGLPALQTTVPPVVEQACYLPTTPDGVPAMGALPVEIAGKSCYVATGHGCWGILLGPASGESMASLIMTGKSTVHVDLTPFRPSRFPSFGLVPQLSI